MNYEDFYKLNTADKVTHILSIEDYQEQQKLLEFLKSKDKFEHIKVSGKVKTIKSNPKSVFKVSTDESDGVIYVPIDKIKNNPYSLDFL